MLEVKRLRKARGWNQTQLAYHAGLAPSVISQIENGKRDPTSRTLRKLAGALEVEVRDLFPLDQAPLPDPGARDRRGFLEHIKTLDYTALSALSEEIHEEQRKAQSVSDLEDATARGLMVMLQMHIVGNPAARFEPVGDPTASFEPAEAKRRLEALAGAA